MIAVDLDAVAIPLQWWELFHRRGPVHIDLGSGKGRFLLELAAARPELNLVGVERARKYSQLISQRAVKRGIANVRIVHTTGEDLLFRLLPEASVDTLYVLFPDPWPKKRHHKRRFFRHETAQRITEVLRPGGRLLAKTDHPDYAEVIAEVLADLPGTHPLNPDQAFADLPITGFEHKYRAEGRRIWAFARERAAGP